MRTRIKTIKKCRICGKEITDNKHPRRVYCSQKCFGESRRNRKYFVCKNCGKKSHCRISQFKYYKGAGSFCSRECHYQYYRKYPEKRADWKGGKYKDQLGYIVMRDGRDGKIKQTREHVYKMEEFLGRKLTKDEVVHHINGKKDDNRLKNLKLMTKTEHHRLHYKIGDGIAKLHKK